MRERPPTGGRSRVESFFGQVHALGERFSEHAAQGRVGAPDAGALDAARQKHAVASADVLEKLTIALVTFLWKVDFATRVWS